MFCEKTESDRKSLWRKIRARQNGAGAGSPCPARSFKRISLKKKIPYKSGFDSSTSSNDSEEPSHCHKIPRISVVVYKENLILIATCKSPWNSACNEWDMLKSSRAQGVLTYQKVTGIFDNPHIIFIIYFLKYLFL